MKIIPADATDIPALVVLLNSGYRGDASKKGWTTEADLIRGDLRTDENSLQTLMKKSGAIFLKYINEQTKVEGCVFLEKKEDKLYLGMLCVSPEAQAKGIGKQMMKAATEYARSQSCRSIFMKVISVRRELVAWYEKQGYKKTGEKEPFPDDNRFGTPTQPLEFIILEKEL